MTAPGGQRSDQRGVPPKYLRTAEVVYPDEVRRSFRIHKNAEGQILFDLATDFVLLAPSTKAHLALSFFDKKNLSRFVRNDVPIGKQIPAKHWTFYLTFKFYSPEPAELRDALCRHYLLCQCRRDVVSGKLPTDLITRSRLAAFIAQMELGDYSPKTNYDRYYKDALSKQSGDSEFISTVQRYHETFRGQTPFQAELNFLEYCKTLPLYGCHRTLTRDGKRPYCIELAIGAAGLCTYEMGKGISSFYPWQIIDKITYRRKFFCLKFVPDSKINTAGSMIFKLASSSSAERFYVLVLEHHAYFRLVKPASLTVAPPPSPSQNPKTRAKGGLLEWASRRFVKRSPDACQPLWATLGDEETVMTVRFEDTCEFDETMAGDDNSMFDRTTCTEDEGEGSVYTLDQNDNENKLDVNQNKLEAIEVEESADGKGNDPGEEPIVSEEYAVILERGDQKLVRMLELPEEDELSGCRLLRDADGSVDYEAELCEALLEATKLNPRMVVESYADLN